MPAVEIARRAPPAATERGATDRHGKSAEHESRRAPPVANGLNDCHQRRVHVEDERRGGCGSAGQRSEEERRLDHVSDRTQEEDAEPLSSGGSQRGAAHGAGSKQNEATDSEADAERGRRFESGLGELGPEHDREGIREAGRAAEGNAEARATGILGRRHRTTANHREFLTNLVGYCHETTHEENQDGIATGRRGPRLHR